jgi:hypothetical protein
MLCDGVDPGALVEVCARETLTRKIQPAKQIADVRNRKVLSMAIISIFAQEEPIKRVEIFPPDSVRRTPPIGLVLRLARSVRGLSGHAFWRGMARAA